ncbi:hypothetical protein PENTCL1PPCAC_12663, partial [Pristionchus entomophagus]
MTIDWERLKTVRFNHSELISIAVGAENHFYFAVQARFITRIYKTFQFQCSIAYFFVIFSIKFFMRNREPFDLQRPLNAWNLVLAVFSSAGAIFMAPDFFGVLWRSGFRASYCELDGMFEGLNGWWMWIFVLSKLTEFTDTLFIVLRKKPLLFLHWYHHILTLIYSVYTYSSSTAFNRYLTYLNLVVHSAMYSYYFLRSIRVPIPGAIAKAITTSQILQAIRLAVSGQSIFVQFVISIVVLVLCGVEYYLLESQSDCAIDIRSFWFASIMDLSYLVLFFNFFLNAYVVKGGKDKYKKV